jgi:excisionase family DNA binding protein
LDKVTVAEAAEQLGISQDAVRRRIRQGTIDYERTEQGRLYVYLPPEDTRLDGVPYTAQEELIKHIQRENDFLRKQLERKDHLLAAALERIPLALGASPKAQEPPPARSPSEASSYSEIGRQPAEEAHEKRDERQSLAESLERVDPASSQKAKEDSQTQEQLPETNQSGLSGLAARAVWVRVGLATFLAGTVPPILANLVLLMAAYYAVGYAINHPPLMYVYLFFYFLAHLLPLPLGRWAGLTWPGSHPRGYLLLGITAGGITALTTLSVVTIFGHIIRIAVEDYIAIISTITLFLSGALYADLLEVRRRITTASAGAVSANEAALNKTTLLLIQSAIPALIGLVGTIVAALVPVLSS